MVSSQASQISAVTEDSIVRLIDAFYAKVRTDAEIGPVFERQIGEDQWPAHLIKMYAFWSAVMLGTQRYKGNPLLKHAAIKELQAPMFERWLALFAQTAAEIFCPAVAEEFRQKSTRIATSLKLGLFDYQSARAGNEAGC